MPFGTNGATPWLSRPDKKRTSSALWNRKLRSRCNTPGSPTSGCNTRCSTLTMSLIRVGLSSIFDARKIHAGITVCGDCVACRFSRRA